MGQPDDAEALVVTFAELFAVLAQAGKRHAPAARTIVRDFSRSAEALVPAGLASLSARGWITIVGESVELDPRLAIAGHVLGEPRSWAEVAVDWSESATLSLAWENELALVVLTPRAFGAFELRLLPPVASVAVFVATLAELLTDDDSGAQALRARLNGADVATIEVVRCAPGVWTLAADAGSLQSTALDLPGAVERAVAVLIGAAGSDATDEES